MLNYLQMRTNRGWVQRPESKYADANDNNNCELFYYMDLEIDIWYLICHIGTRNGHEVVCVCVWLASPVRALTSSSRHQFPSGLSYFSTLTLSINNEYFSYRSRRTVVAWATFVSETYSPLINNPTLSDVYSFFSGMCVLSIDTDLGKHCWSSPQCPSYRSPSLILWKINLCMFFLLFFFIDTEYARFWMERSRSPVETISKIASHLQFRAIETVIWWDEVICLPVFFLFISVGQCVHVHATRPIVLSHMQATQYWIDPKRYPSAPDVHQKKRLHFGSITVVQWEPDLVQRHVTDCNWFSKSVIYSMEWIFPFLCCRWCCCRKK